MEIEPVSFFSTTSAKDRWLDLWARKLQVEQRSGPASVDAMPEPSVPEAATVDVEFAEHDGTGAQVVRLRDHDTGRIVSQLPYQEVLDLVASLMQQNALAQQRGEGDDGQH